MKAKIVITAAIISCCNAAYAGYSEIECESHVYMLRMLADLREENSGLPIGKAEKIAEKSLLENSKKNPPTYALIRKTIRKIYASPADGSSYVYSDRFERDCIRTNPGHDDRS